MTLQVSTRKLLLQEIRQNSWMFWFSALLHFLTGPVVFLLSTSNYANWTEVNAAHRFSSFFTDNFFIWQIFVIIGCICISIFTYKYLFSKRTIDLYHSVPISRGQLFLVKYLHGFLIWFLPFLLNVLSVFLLFCLRTSGKSYMISGLWQFGKSILLLLLCFFIFYHLFLTAVYLSGNVLNMFVNTALIGCSILGLYMLYIGYLSTYFETYCSDPSTLMLDIVYSISPFTTPFAIMAFLTSEGLKNHLPMLVLSIPVSLGLLGTSWILCLRRPSELAERGTNVRKYIQPARIVAALLAGLAGALFFSEISSGNATLAWGLFGALLCSVVCFGIITSIFQTTIKYFFQNKYQMLSTAVLSAAIVVIFQLDVFGYDTYLPDKEDIAGMAIYTNVLSDGSSYLTSPNTGSIRYDRTQNVTQTELVTDPDTCYNMLTLLRNQSQNGTYSNGVYTKITLKNGHSYERRYRIWNENYRELADFVETDAYQATNYKYSTGLLGYPNSLQVDLMNSSFDLKEPMIREIMDAYRADFKDHYTLDELTSYMKRFELSGRYEISDSSQWFSLDIPDNYSRTITLLEELYPEFTSLPSCEDITDLYINLYHLDIEKTDDISLNLLYDYFGYEVTETDTEEVPLENTEITPNNTTSTFVEIADNTKPVAEAYEVYDLTIRDQETIAAFYPYLTFGQLRSNFSRKEYIYLGEIYYDNHSINCYVKPGELPKELIDFVMEQIDSQNRK